MTTTADVATDSVLLTVGGGICLYLTWDVISAILSARKPRPASSKRCPVCHHEHAKGTTCGVRVPVPEMSEKPGRFKDSADKAAVMVSCGCRGETGQGQDKTRTSGRTSTRTSGRDMSTPGADTTGRDTRTSARTRTRTSGRTSGRDMSRTSRQDMSTPDMDTTGHETRTSGRTSSRTRKDKD